MDLLRSFRKEDEAQSPVLTCPRSLTKPVPEEEEEDFPRLWLRSRARLLYWRSMCIAWKPVSVFNGMLSASLLSQLPQLCPRPNF